MADIGRVDDEASHIGLHSSGDHRWDELAMPGRVENLTRFLDVLSSEGERLSDF